MAERPPKWPPSVSRLMQNYRCRRMTEFLTRDPRIFDVTLIDNLRQGTAFFASAAMIAIGGGVALIGSAAALQGQALDRTIRVDAAGLRIKLIVEVALLANALLKFVWSHRLFGYCAIRMAAVPNDFDDPMAAPRARQAVQITITAAKCYNRCLNSIYFALSALGWLIGPQALIVATVLTAGVAAGGGSSSLTAFLAGPAPSEDACQGG